jgi:hypothetical protein
VAIWCIPEAYLSGKSYFSGVNYIYCYEKLRYLFLAYMLNILKIKGKGWICVEKIISLENQVIAG